ncbi:heat shock protein 70kD, putative [Entamoeba dispar SAW760]|uniref:Heat shock protein 70kD, putative n=1 Tax=Entamoeba dispar (strain ATCC PRA-260 / SAW760) TaxID=370354 RepID=B0E7Y3_ENTDS|nr:heat shock protein 70kD, putative [Entamoeba dispar SAW760]EDR29373.1 heat shock protein 70kD, putative [Entamoeba dispar SAW760]|eukprot:EDR29373.1 heat shock protein 70kD, putative [Entamoeba dispar SAW760]
MDLQQLNEVPVHIGIDLGTTYSSIAIYLENETNPVEVLQISNNEFSVPSWVEIFKGSGGTKKYNVGIRAKNNGSICLHDSKRLIGETVKRYRQQKGLLPSLTSFDVSTEKDEIKMCVEDPLDSSKIESFYPIEVSTLVLRTLYNIFIQKNYSRKVGKVVVTVPVSFTPRQKKETIQACKMAGFEDVYLLEEPFASILEYKREHHLKDESKIIVIDCGGGTTDVACCITHGYEMPKCKKLDFEKIRNIVLEKVKETQKTNPRILDLFEPEKWYNFPKTIQTKRYLSNCIDKITNSALTVLQQNKPFTFNTSEISRNWNSEITIKLKDVIKQEEPNLLNEIKTTECVWNESDLNLGGNNFDDSLIKVILNKIKESVDDSTFKKLFVSKSSDTKATKKKKSKIMKQIRNNAEEIKKSFSGNVSYSPIDLYSISTELDGSIEITREEFEEQCKKDGLIEKIKQCIENVVGCSSWNIDDIDYVLPIGGSCCIPLVRKTICDMFGENKIIGFGSDGYLSVVKGAAYRAHQISINKEDNITQVMPYTLGFGLVDDSFSIFASKGKKLPIIFENIYSNAFDNQRSITNTIYKGEGRKTNDKGMELVTEVTVELPPGLKAGEFKMIYKTTVNRSGLVEVDIVKKDTGERLEKMKVFVNLGFDEDMLKKIQQHLEPYIKNSE